MNGWAWLEKLPTRESRIVTLLDWYMDVEHGLRDQAFYTGEGVIGMCRSWNHPSYKQLRRHLLAMRDTQEFLYWHVAERFIRCQSRRVLKCPRCIVARGANSAVSAMTLANLREYTPIDKFLDDGTPAEYHQHGRDRVLLVPFAMKEWSHAVRPELVKAGVEWLGGRWIGEPFLPDELLARAA